MVNFTFFFIFLSSKSHFEKKKKNSSKHTKELILYTSRLVIVKTKSVDTIALREVARSKQGKDQLAQNDTRPDK